MVFTIILIHRHHVMSIFMKLKGKTAMYARSVSTFTTEKGSSRFTSFYPM